MRPFDVYPLFDIRPVSGEGAWLLADDGQQYLDFHGGHAVISIGHSHPTYLAALAEQMAKLSFCSNSVKNDCQLGLAAKLGEVSKLFQLSVVFV